MTQLATNRSTSNTAAEHVSDHNTLHAQHNDLDGHAAATTDAHGITDTADLATDADVTSAVSTHAGAADPHAGYVLESAHTTAAHDALTLSHDSLASVSSDDHHAKSHTHDGVDGSGTVSHASLSNLTSGDPHTQYLLKSLVDAAGDLLVGSDADTVTRLAAGSEDDVLTIVSGVPAWAAPSGATVWQDHTGAALTASVSNPVLGTGGGAGIEARYAASGDSIQGTVFVQFGTSGTSRGSGEYRYQLPVAPRVSAFEIIIGMGYLWIGTGSSVPWMMVVIPAGATYARFRQIGIVTAVSDTSPGTFTTTGQLSWNYSYEAA